MKRLYDKLVTWMFKPYLGDFKVVKVLGYGIFRVDTKRGGQRMTLHIPWRYSLF